MKAIQLRKRSILGYIYSLLIGLKQSHEYRTFAGFGLGGGGEGPWQPRATAGKSYDQSPDGANGGTATRGTRFIVARTVITLK